MTTQEQQLNRAGLTRTTSVSVSKEFFEIIKRYNLSPTEVFRKGVTVSLCEAGIDRYYNEINRERLDKANEILDSIRKIDNLRLKLVEVKDALEKLNKI